MGKFFRTNVMHIKQDCIPLSGSAAQPSAQEIAYDAHTVIVKWFAACRTLEELRPPLRDLNMVPRPPADV